MGCGPASTAARGVTLPRLCAMGLGPVRLARSPALFCLFWLLCLALPCPGWLAAPLRTGNGSSMPEGRSSRDRTAPSAGMQPQPSLSSSASKCEGGTFWLPTPWLVLKSLRDPLQSCQPSPAACLSQLKEHDLCLGWGNSWRHCLFQSGALSLGPKEKPEEWVEECGTEGGNRKPLGCAVGLALAAARKRNSI